MIVAAVLVAWPILFPPHPAPLVEITELTIGGQKTRTSAADNSYTEITYTLRHNDGLKHKVTVLFNFTTEGARYVTIVTAPGQPLARSGNTFHYDKMVDPADSLLPQKVLAWARISGLPSVTVNITISLLVDGQPVGTAQTVTLQISA